MAENVDPNNFNLNPEPEQDIKEDKKEDEEEEEIKEELSEENTKIKKDLINKINAYNNVKTQKNKEKLLKFSDRIANINNMSIGELQQLKAEIENNFSVQNPTNLILNYLPLGYNLLENVTTRYLKTYGLANILQNNEDFNANIELLLIDNNIMNYLPTIKPEYTLLFTLAFTILGLHMRNPQDIEQYKNIVKLQEEKQKEIIKNLTDRQKEIITDTNK
jgi:molecular chaperone GrpE (heat shock protein)